MSLDMKTNDAARSTYNVVIFRQYVFILLLCSLLAGLGVFVGYSAFSEENEHVKVEQQLTTVIEKLNARDETFANIIDVVCVNGDTVVVKTQHDETRIPMKCSTGG